MVSLVHPHSKHAGEDVPAYTERVLKLSRVEELFMKRLSFIGAVFALACMPLQSLALDTGAVRSIASRDAKAAGQWNVGTTRDRAQAKDCETKYKESHEERLRRWNAIDEETNDAKVKSNRAS